MKNLLSILALLLIITSCKKESAQVVKPTLKIENARLYAEGDTTVLAKWH